MSKKYSRFFTPNIKSWKYIDSDSLLIPKKKYKAVMNLSNKNKDAIIDNSTELLGFTISFTKTVVRISFVLFVVVNLFILAMTTISYFHSGELMYLDTLITESYGMLRDVIAAYIIKAATENSLRIGFSVLSDYLDKKYDIKVKPSHDEYDYYENEFDVDVPEDDEDPMNGIEFDSDDKDSMDGGIDFIKR